MAKEKKNPTNSDIYSALGRLDEKVSAIHSQVQKTNGRVSLLEIWRRELDVIATYKKDNPSRPTQEVREGWTTREKQLIAFITALIGLIATMLATG